MMYLPSRDEEQQGEYMIETRLKQAFTEEPFESEDAYNIKRLTGYVKEDKIKS